MSVQVMIQPYLVSGNGGLVTRLLVTVDCLSIQQFLARYDVMLKTSISVATLDETTQTPSVRIYDYSNIYSECKDNKIEFEALVYGEIIDVNSVQCRTQASLVCKRKWGNEPN